MRNYLGELKSLGYTIKYLSSELGISSKRVSAIINQKEKIKSSESLYEEIRNLSRNTLSQELQKQGFHGKFVSANRRLSFDKFETIESELETLVESTYKKWNRSYLAWEKNPDKWMQKHLYYKNPPKEMTREEIERRIQKGASRVKELSEAKDSDGVFRSP